MEEYKIGIVIPAFNEQDSLAKLIPIIKNYGNVLVINDGSTDETQKIINQFKCQYIKNEKNLGYEKNLLNGIKKFKSNFLNTYSHISLTLCVIPVDTTKSNGSS